MVLRPLSKNELEDIFDEYAQEVIMYFLEKTILLQPEVNKNQEALPIQIPKEHIEQWFVQAIRAKSVGAGSFPVDIVLKNKFSADVKMLSCKLDKKGELKEKTLSGETSLAQKFKSTGEDLDSLFRDGKYDEILNGWKKILSSKMQSVKDKFKNIPIYYFFFLRAGTNFYLCGCEFNVEKIEDTYVLEKSNDKSVFVDGFIKSKYGEVKIYKAKKRMELRLYPAHWVEKGKAIKFETKSTINPVDLREKAEARKLDDYKREQFKSFIYKRGSLDENRK